MGRRRGMEQLGFWRKLLEHPAYDAFWRDQAMDWVLASRQLKVPVMVVHRLWDQEDIYGAPAVYRALEPKDPANDQVFLVIGPWFHGQQIARGHRARARSTSAPTRPLVPAGGAPAVPRPVPQGRRAEGRRRPGHRLRVRDERLAAAARLAAGLRPGLQDRADAALSRSPA